jgi:hypothetical protein
MKIFFFFLLDIYAQDSLKIQERKIKKKIVLSKT